MRTTELTLIEDYGHLLAHRVAENICHPGHDLLMDFVFDRRDTWQFDEVIRINDELRQCPYNIRDFVKSNKIEEWIK